MSKEPDYQFDNNGADSNGAGSINVSDTQMNSTNAVSNLTNSKTDNSDRIAEQAEQTTIEYNQSATEKQESAKTTNQIENSASSKNKPIGKSKLNKSVTNNIDDIQINSEDKEPKNLNTQPENHNSDSEEKYQPDENKNSRLKNLLQIITKFPEVNRDFLLLLPNLSAEDFQLYCLEVFKALEKNGKEVWKTQAAIGYDIFERNELFKSKGGNKSAGEGIGKIFQDECAKIGVSSSTLRDNLRIYQTFVVTQTLDIQDKNIRRKKQLDILDGMNLKRYFYIRSCTAVDPIEAIEMAKRRLVETGGEYTETEFMKDLKRRKENSSKPAENPSVVPTKDPEREDLVCQPKRRSIKYLISLTMKWGMTVGELIDHLVETHQKSNNPKEVSI